MVVVHTALPDQIRSIKVSICILTAFRYRQNTTKHVSHPSAKTRCYFMYAMLENKPKSIKIYKRLMFCVWRSYHQAKSGYATMHETLDSYLSKENRKNRFHCVLPMPLKTLLSEILSCENLWMNWNHLHGQSWRDYLHTVLGNLKKICWTFFFPFNSMPTL